MAASTPHKLSSLEAICKFNKEKRLKPGGKTRYAWNSVLHDKLLSVTFTQTDKANDKKKLVLSNLTEKQKIRSIKSASNKVFEMRIPVEKIGHVEDLNLGKLCGDDSSSKVEQLGKVRLRVSTNGFTKILTVTDSIGTKL